MPRNYGRSIIGRFDPQDLTGTLSAEIEMEQNPEAVNQFKDEFMKIPRNLKNLKTGQVVTLEEFRLIPKKKIGFDGERDILRRLRLIQSEYGRYRVHHNGDYMIQVDEQYVFSKTRKFRVDFRVELIGRIVLIDYEGGIFAKTRTGHSSGMGIIRDCEKSNLAQSEGYVFLRFTEKLLKRPGYFEEVVKKTLGIIQ